MGTTLSKSVGLLLGILLLGMGGLVAGDGPGGPPDKDLLRKLIADEAEVLERTINIGIVLPGKVTTSDGFQADHAVRVVYLWEEKRGTFTERVVAEKTFLWNEEFGWFTWGRNDLRGAEVLDICSERKGLIRLR